MKNRINRIKEVLVIQDRSQTWLAEKLGKTRVTVSNYCNNNMQPPLETLLEIAHILDVDVRELLVASK